MTEEFGRYQLLEKLAAGGVAEVYVAQIGDSAEERFTLKRLHREHLEEPEVIQAFLAEAELTMKLIHPNLVRVYDFGREGEDYYIAAEYIEGVDLAALRRPDRIGISAALQIAVDVGAALDHVHERARVVHADLSPRNILVGTDGVARVTDFGVAVELGAALQPVRGTYAYMSPEQARGEPVDARSDVFAFGILIWELVQRRRLFRRAEQFLTIAAVVEDEAPPIDVLPEINSVVQRALMKAREDRWPSCGQLTAALVQACKPLGVAPERDAVVECVRDALG